MSRLTLISVPFHLGARGVAVGAGPLDLLGERGLAQRLGQAGHELELVEVPQPDAGHEPGRVFAITRELADQVAVARRGGRLPVILSGDCNACVGALAGIGPGARGIVWLDAHADFNTPDTSGSGFLDGMGLAIATGGCWRALAGSIPGFEPVPERDAVIVGAWDVDPGEQARLERGRVPVIRGGGGPGTLALRDLEQALDGLSSRAQGVYLHVDFDVVDTGLGLANAHASAGGLSLEDLSAVTERVAERTPVLAVAYTGYDPGADPEGRFGDTAARAIELGLGALSAAAAGTATG